jgi:hypothetical protein
MIYCLVAATVCYILSSGSYSVLYIVWWQLQCAMNEGGCLLAKWAIESTSHYVATYFFADVQ